MDLPPMMDQKFSDSTLKGMLLSNLDKNTSETGKIINKILVEQVDKFWEEVVIPLRNKNKFDGNKIKWYYQVYKEGLEARRLILNPFNFMTCDLAKVNEIIAFYQGKSLNQYLELGVSFLSNTFMILNAWLRDQLILKRLDTVYYSVDPVDWIIKAESDATPLADKNVSVPGLIDLINNISILLGRRV